MADLPEILKTLFWDYDPGAVSWERDRDFVIERTLTHGDWDAIQWVRGQVGDPELRRVILQSRARKLSRRQIRFWQLILDLPEDTVAQWLSERESSLWK